jgi:hypothetical protein
MFAFDAVLQYCADAPVAAKARTAAKIHFVICRPHGFVVQRIQPRATGEVDEARSQIVQPWLRGGSFARTEMSRKKIHHKIFNDYNVMNGAANRTRTCDPVITNDVLYQLSYCGGPSGAFGQRAKNART